MPAYKTTSKLTGATSWYCSFYYTDYYGERKRKKKEGFALKREAEEYERTFLERMSDTPSIPFEVMVEHFLDDKSSSVRPSTLHTYNIWLKNILPYLEGKPTNEIKPSHIRRIQNDLVAKHTKHTAKALLTLISSIFSYAVKFHGLKQNPCKLAGTPKYKNDTSEEKHFMTTEQFQKLIKCVSRYDMSILLVLLFYTGIRAGEALALRPKDINLDERTISITRTQVTIDNHIYYNPPKTKAGHRIIAIPEMLNILLCDYINITGTGKDNLLFELLSRAVIQSNFKASLKLAGLPQELRIHDLRHSHASLLIEMGFSPTAIKERLGHEDVRTTLNIYAHLYPSKHNEIADKLNDLMINSTKLVRNENT